MASIGPSHGPSHGAARPLPPDEGARHVIRTALADNLLVEAGAGSGKTTALVDRMLRLVAGGHARIDEIAAVTFTRKAAGELRQRFQERLERALAEGAVDAAGGPDDPEVRARLQQALVDIDRAFMGTIHAFCARLLRERPLDARLDPAFRELTAPEERTLARRFWDQHLERLAAEDDGTGILTRLDEVGVRPSQLFEHFRNMNEASDVEFPLAEADPPDEEALARVRAELESIVDAAAPGISGEKPEKGWDWLQGKLRQIRYLRSALDFDRPVALFTALDVLCTSQEAKVTFNRWDALPKAAVESLRDRTNDLIQVTPTRPHPPARHLLERWKAHRYAPVLELVQGASRAFARHRRQTAQLTFHDLLVLATDLLRRSPDARAGLGERWRRILVDEFQDTDPLQAELLFLLASDPLENPAEGGWASLTPRAGALFVVGDPKQSIYRFRRADISLYGRVRDRFPDFGQVVTLTANFRSTPPIESLVEGVFSPLEAGGGGLFPAEGTELQAGYAPLLTQVARGGRPKEGVFRYEIPPQASGNAGELTTWEAGALAEWIAQRVALGERAPEDFLILTRTRRHLAAYARALEARGVAVVVSGSGVGIEDELRELRLLLRALVDPDDALTTLAALEGLFFGVDPEALLAHVEGGGRLDFRRDEGQPPGPVTDALGVLREWWELARSRSADEVVERIVASVGLLPWAASGELGGLRAGALSFTLDLVRTATVSEDASLAGALEALGLVLDDDDSEVESPLEPGRGGAVRLMNLHKAKGLEAPVVVLACPTGNVRLGRSLVVERDAEGRSLGWCAVDEPRGEFSRAVVAAPPDWAERAERETRFSLAENDRLLYVAVTRAAEELVVGMQPPGSRSRGPWEKLEPWLAGHAQVLELAPGPVPPRRPVDGDAGTLAAEEDEAAARRDAAGTPGWRFETVTGLARGESNDEPADLFAAAGLAVDPAAGTGPAPASGLEGPGSSPEWGWSTADATGPGGYTWGNAVHATLEAALGGLTGDALEGVARTALLENERPVAEGEPVELDALLRLVERVRDSDLWRRALAADRRLTEEPFVVELEDGAFLEGVVDLAFREDGAWVIVDYKTAADDRVFAARLPHYERQIALYAEAWTHLTGEPVKETRVWRVG